MLAALAPEPVDVASRPTRQPVPASVLAAFGFDDTDRTVPLAGGQNVAWRIRDLVLKPCAAGEPVAWLAALLAQVDDGSAFRVARPAAATDGAFVVDGWTATTWVAGHHDTSGTDRLDDVLAVSEAFHAALANAQVAVGISGRDSPPELQRRSPWAVGLRVALGDEEPGPVAPSVAAALARLEPLLSRARSSLASRQVVHADLGNGNVLFADDEGLPPAVIDVSPAWAPAPFAAAVAVADEIAWQGAPVVHALRFAARRPDGDGLLAQAIVYRIIAAQHLWPAHPARVDAEVAGYGSVLALLPRS